MVSFPDHIQHGYDATLRQLLLNQLRWMLFIRVVLYTLLLGVSVFLQKGMFNVTLLPPNLLLLFIITVYVSSIVSALVLFRETVNPWNFAVKQTLLDTLFVSVLVYFTGGAQSIFAPIYFFPIIAGSLIIPRLGGIIAAGAATLQYGTALALVFYGIYPEFLNILIRHSAKSDPLSIMNMFAVYGLTFFLAALIASLFSGRLRKTEDALSNSVRDFDRLTLLYKQIFDDINTGIITTNDHNQISSANNAACEITGYKVSELLNISFPKIFPNVTFHNKGTRHAAELTRKSGETVRIGYSYAKLQYQDGKPHTCKNCKVITIQDISEVERLEKQMQQAEKLAAIGRMSAGIAHDFRNPLAAISGSAQVLANELSRIPSTHQQSNTELINIILRESNRLSNTVSDFLKFARPEHAEKDWISLGRCLGEVIQVAKAGPTWPETCTLEVIIDKNTDIWADQYQLFTILNHLLQNALAFCPEGRELIKIVAREKKGESHSNTNDRIDITVEDNGPGILPGLEKKIFEPFYTKRVDGTGLGLAIVKQMVQEHEGTITVEKSTMGGARFVVSIPLPPA